MNKNDRITITISSMSSQGLGIGRAADNTAVFVAGAAIGDKVEVIIVKVLKNYCFGKIVDYIEQSPDRIEPNCDAFSRCGGCCYRHISYEAELNIKQKRVSDAVCRIGKIAVPINPIIGADKRDRYRNKAQFPVGVDKNGKSVCGFYALHSHRIVPCTDCMLQPPEFDGILRFLLRFTDDNRIPVYDETADKGILRHIYLRRTADEDIMVCLVINADRLPKEIEKSLVNGLCDGFPEVKTVVLNINKRKTGVILGDKNRVLFGDGYLTDTLCGIKIKLSPLSFYQVNRDMAERLYTVAAEYAEVYGKTVLDLYCGAGAIGLSMAKTAREIIGVEIVPSAVKDARHNAEINGIENARFICADAAAAAKQLADEGIRPDVIILDPPRKGADSSLIHTIAEDFAPKRVVYVSCDPATLARDLAVFETLGYKTEKVQPVDMFPSTSHVETVVCLSRKKVNDRINFDINIEALPDRVSKTATYVEIKAYVLEHYGLKVSSLYIAQIKDKHGIKERENYNIGEGKSKEVICPPEKEEAITNALKHFNMI